MSIFYLEGEFREILFKDGYKPKYLKLATTQGDVLIKIPKHLRNSIRLDWKYGEQLSISVTRTLNYNNGTVKLEATEINPIHSVKPSLDKVKTKKTTVMICQKSGCRKRGSGGVCQTLQQLLADQNLTDQVEIRETGCMKACDQGPNLLIMPNKARFTRVNPNQVSEILSHLL